MDPAEARTLIVEDVQEVLGQVAGGLPVVRLSAELERASQDFQAIAICHLLERLDSEAFRINLLRSVHARRYFLLRCRQQGNTADRRLALSRTEALFDALAAGHDSTLQSLIQHSIVRHVPGWEYEDDFIYMRWIQELATGAPADALEATARQRRQALGRPPDARQAALLALSAGDRPALSIALHALAAELDEHAQQQLAGSLEPDLDTCLLWPRSFVSVELLALLALANRRGLVMDEPFPMCLTQGRLPRGGADTEDFFAGIERVRANDAGSIAS